MLDQVLFQSHKKKTSIELRHPLPEHLKPPYVEKITVGRRIEIREIISLALANKYVSVIGPCGMGKTMLVKRAAQYAYDRRIFKDGVVYLDFLMKTDIIFLYRYISNTLNLPSFNHYTDLCSALSNLDVLMILDNIDPLLKHDKQTFLETYQHLINNASKPKFIITSQTDIMLERAEKFIVSSLSVEQAKRLIRNLCGNRNIERLGREYFSNISTKPSDILQLVPAIISGKVEAGTPSGSSLSMSLRLIKNILPKSEDFFRLLSYFPSGVYNMNLKYICQELDLNYKEILEKLKVKDEGDCS